jgi:hypothetical protein
VDDAPVLDPGALKVDQQGKWRTRRPEIVEALSKVDRPDLLDTLEAGFHDRDE